jgi:hypothetical protein
MSRLGAQWVQDRPRWEGTRAPDQRPAWTRAPAYPAQAAVPVELMLGSQRGTGISPETVGFRLPIETNESLSRLFER